MAGHLRHQQQPLRLDPTIGHPHLLLDHAPATPGNRQVVLGRLSPAQRAILREALLRRLAGTGSDNTGIAVLGVVAVFAGSALVIAATRRRSPLRGSP
jgi:LPXTG-motif cell wall-anchored protein